MADPSPAAEPAPDSYEAKYMGAGRSLARTRKSMPWWFFVFLAVAAISTVVSTVVSGNAIPLLISLPLLALTALLLSHVRCVVTEQHVHIQFGLFGPKIAVGCIDKVTVEAYSPLKYGGWGIRLGRDGSWAYSVPGGTGQGVRIEYRNARGSTRAAFVSTDEAAEVMAAIEKARALAATTGVRVKDTGSTGALASGADAHNLGSTQGVTRGATRGGRAPR